MKHNVLGKGLTSLLKEEIVPLERNALVEIVHINDIKPNDLQPRKKFDPVTINELADSIIHNGLIQPIIVNKKDSSGKYTIVAGERRFRACKVAAVTDIPVIIKNLTSKEILEIALIENIQRAELTVIEEAEGFQRLIDEFGYTQLELSEIIGKSRSHISNILRLNGLPQSIKLKINDGKLSMGHARCLVGIEKAEMLADKIINHDLSVRQTEALTRRQNTSLSQNTSNSDNTNNNDMKMMAQTLSEQLGVKILIEPHNHGGKIMIYCNDLESLDNILIKLS